MGGTAQPVFTVTPPAAQQQTFTITPPPGQPPRAALTQKPQASGPSAFNFGPIKELFGASSESAPQSAGTDRSLQARGKGVGAPQPKSTSLASRIYRAAVTPVVKTPPQYHQTAEAITDWAATHLPKSIAPTAAAVGSFFPNALETATDLATGALTSPLAVATLPLGSERIAGKAVAPVAQRALAAFFAASQGPQAFKGRQPGETRADEIERRLMGAGALVGAAGAVHGIRGEAVPAEAERPAAPVLRREAVGALPPGKEPLALPPTPGLQTQDVRTFIPPRKKGGPIQLPARTLTRIGPGPEPIPLGPVKLSANDLRGQIAQLDRQERELNRLSSSPRATANGNIARIQKLRKISAQRQALRAQLEEIEPRAAAKPLRKAPGEDEPISATSIGGQSLTHQQTPAARPEPTATDKLLAKAKAEAKEKPKTPTYDSLPQEMREVVDSLAKNHRHLPQSLREADEAEHRKLSAPGTPLKEQIARRVARDEKLPYASKYGEGMAEEKPLAKPLSDRRTPIGERRLENEGAPEGVERRVADRRTIREFYRDQAREELRQEDEQRRKEMGFADIGSEREKMATARAATAPASGAKIGDTVRYRNREGLEGSGKITDRGPTGAWKIETAHGPIAVKDSQIVPRGEAETLPGMETAVREQKAAVGKHQGEELTKELARPLSDIDQRAGEMERNSPLFRDTETSPQRGLFSEGKEPHVSLGEAMPANREAERAAGTRRHDILVDGKKVGEVHVSPKDETLHVTWMGEPLTREGGKPEELNALSNKIGPAGVRQVVRELHRLYPEAEELSYTREGGAAGRSAQEHGEVAARTMLLGKGSRLHAGVDPTMVRDLFDRLGRLYDEHIAGPGIEKIGLGRSHKDVEAVDPQLASRIRRYETAPQYFSTKAADLVKHIVGDLTPAQERLFTLMADADARENLKENHPREFAQAQRDPKIQAALDRYRPWERQLTKARQILGGQTLDRDYLRRIYAEHVEGVGKGAKGKRTPPANFDRIITPKKEGGPGRKATAEYHYAHGLHEFGPAFGTKFTAVMTKIAEHATAMDFLRKATKLEAGDGLPPSITYNGQRYFRPDVVRMIHEARPGEDSKAIARDLGVRELPTPKRVQAYQVYDPAAGRGGPDAPKYLGPRSVVEALHGIDKQSPGKSGPVGRFLREQIIGVGFGVPHAMNLARRISHSFPGGSGNPVNWVRAVRVLTDSELRARSLSRTNDPTYDALLRWGGMSPHQVESFKEYQGGNLNPANWLRTFAHVGHQWLFGPKGIDRSARLYIADLVKSRRPDLSAEKVSQLVNDQLGRYNRATWTDMQKRVGRYMLFPGWDFSSVNWVLRHPIRTTVPPALLVMLANQVIHQYGGNRNDDRFDPFAVHVAGHSYSTTLLSESLGRRAAAPVLRAAEEKLQGGTRRQVAAAFGREAPYATGAPFGMTMPQIRLPVETALGKDEFGRDIVPRGDWTRPGRVLPSKGLEDEIDHALVSFFPQGQRIEEGKQSAAEMALSNLGVQRRADQPRMPEMSERRADILNVKDDLRQVRQRARAIASDRSLSPAEKEEKLAALRQTARQMIERDRP